MSAMTIVEVTCSNSNLKVLKAWRIFVTVVDVELIVEVEHGPCAQPCSIKQILGFHPDGSLDLSTQVAFCPLPREGLREHLVLGSRFRYDSRNWRPASWGPVASFMAPAPKCACAVDVLV